MREYRVIKDYKSLLSIKETEEAIKYVRDNFEHMLCKKLNLKRVSAPLFVLPSTGLNDNLNGFERRVSFKIKGIEEEAEVVQSLAKWKRNALKEYNFNVGEGLYTNMNAIRCDEDLDYIHSCYVDQWDWEKVILKENRTKSYLKSTVKKIYDVIRKLSIKVNEKFPAIKHNLPKDITFITSKELLEQYPNLTPEEREFEACKKYGAVFLMEIGGKLKNGLPHDGRAFDYDDWKLNGDILLYNDVLNIAFEISSMGIRVDAASIVKQAKAKGEEAHLENKYAQDIINGILPFTIGGGIGQSRLCMYMLKKAHIGEVQSSIWKDEDIKKWKEENINLL